MKRSFFLTGSAGALLSVAGCVLQTQEVEKRPNVIVILTDDQGWAQHGLFAGRLDPSKCVPEGLLEKYDCDPQMAMAAATSSMPNLQRLAEEGTLFTDAYVASAICGPSRAALLSGRYPQRMGIYFNKDILATGISADMHLTPFLQQAGYHSAMIGKWHVAKPIWSELDVDSREGYEKWLNRCEADQHPLACGFDYYYGFNNSGTPYYESQNIVQNHELVTQTQYSTDEFTDQAVHFIDRNKNNPFFIYLAYNAVHTPLEDRAPEKYLSRFDTGNPEVDNYYATLAAVDDGIGRILDRLEQLGISENTLICFLSDNGGVVASPFPLNGEFKGFKGQLNDGGLRVPMVMRWPGRIPAGVEYSQPVSALDVLPTALDAAGIQLPDSAEIDGDSLLPQLTGAESSSPHDLLFWAGPHMLFWGAENRPFWTEMDDYLHFRQDEFPKPLHGLGDAPAGFAVRKGRWIYASFIDGKILFDVTVDPAGKNNLIGEKPELAGELEAAAREWMTTLPEPSKWNKESWKGLFE